MELREITQYHEKAPFSGYGMWIVFEMRYRKAHLLHPIHLTELSLSEYEYVKASGGSLWPNNTTKTSFSFDKWRESFKDRVKFFVEHKRPFPYALVAKVISEIDEISIEKAAAWIASLDTGSTTKSFSKQSVEYVLRKGTDISSVKGRPSAIVTALSENGPASIDRITSLVEGKLKTKSRTGRVVTYFVHKLTAQGILEIVT